MSLHYGCPESLTIAQPDAPLANETVTLFDSDAMFGPGQLRQMNATMLEVTFMVLAQDSASSGLIAYTPDSDGTYVQNNLKNDAGTDTLPVQVTSAGIPRTWRFVLSPYKEFKLDYVNGATGLDEWSVDITLHCGGLAVVR